MKQCSQKRMPPVFLKVNTQVAMKGANNLAIRRGSQVEVAAFFRNICISWLGTQRPGKNTYWDATLHLQRTAHFELLVSEVSEVH